MLTPPLDAVRLVHHTHFVMPRGVKLAPHQIKTVILSEAKDPPAKPLPDRADHVPWRPFPRLRRGALRAGIARAARNDDVCSSVLRFDPNAVIDEDPRTQGAGLRDAHLMVLVAFRKAMKPRESHTTPPDLPLWFTAPSQHHSRMNIKESDLAAHGRRGPEHKEISS
jgi:hypothetical protein